jgi:hypothetical protein
VEEAQTRVNSAAFTRWQAFDQLSPIGHKRRDRMVAEQCATVMRSVGIKCTWENFMPVFDQSEMSIGEKVAVALAAFQKTE